MEYTISKLKKKDGESYNKGGCAYHKRFGVTNFESVGLTASATTQASQGGMHAAQEYNTASALAQTYAHNQLENAIVEHKRAVINREKW